MKLLLHIISNIRGSISSRASIYRHRPIAEVEALTAELDRFRSPNLRRWPAERSHFAPNRTSSSSALSQVRSSAITALRSWWGSAGRASSARSADSPVTLPAKRRCHRSALYRRIRQRDLWVSILLEGSAQLMKVTLKCPNLVVSRRAGYVSLWSFAISNCSSMIFRRNATPSRLWPCPRFLI